MGSLRWRIIVFVAGVLAVVAALSYLTVHSLRLERAELIARREAKFQESIRLVLWRMDSAITPIIAREAARPHFEYESFYPADRAYTRRVRDVDAGEVLVPSPLLHIPDPLVRLNFQVEPSGEVVSPQVPSGMLRSLAEPTYVSAYSIATNRERLDSLRILMTTPAPAASLAIDAAELSAKLEQSQPRTEVGFITQSDRNAESRLQQNSRGSQTEESLSAQEFQARQNVTDYAKNINDSELRKQRAQPQYAQTPTGEPQSGGKAQDDAARTAEKAIAADLKMADKDAAGNNGPISADNRSQARSESGAAPNTQTGAAADPVSAAPSDASDKRPWERGAPGSSGERASGRETAEKTPVPETGKKEVSEKDQEALKVPAMPGSAPSIGGASVHPTGDGLKGAEPWLDAIDAGAGPNQPEVLPPTTTEPEVEQTGFRAMWVQREPDAEPQLLFVREVVIEGETVKQGFWLDWPVLRDELVASAMDLLPGTSLKPVVMSPGARTDQMLGRMLAAIPAELIVPTLPEVETPAWSPMRTTLATGWGAALIAVLAIVLVLRASFELAERRGRFVSAVTHELRTPLTTFCLYSQMLDDGMVQDEGAKREYVRTLRDESQRLARIVESVLEYAKLGRRRSGPTRATVRVGALLDQVVPPLAARSAQCGLELICERGAGMDRLVTTDAEHIERILSNLIDNACKYAKGTDRRVHLVAEAVGGTLSIIVRDHGPGIPASEKRRIFRAFFRGKSQSHGGEPGLGLGLALSQGLANELGGELKLMDVAEGAAFRLTITME